MKPEDTDDLKSGVSDGLGLQQLNKAGQPQSAIELMGHWPTGHLAQNMIDILAIFFLKLRVKSVQSRGFMEDLVRPIFSQNFLPGHASRQGRSSESKAV
jgi:hypothetical protein